MFRESCLRRAMEQEEAEKKKALSFVQVMSPASRHRWHLENPSASRSPERDDQRAAQRRDSRSLSVSPVRRGHIGGHSQAKHEDQYETRLRQRRNSVGHPSTPVTPRQSVPPSMSPERHGHRYSQDSSSESALESQDSEAYMDGSCLTLDQQRSGSSGVGVNMFDNVFFDKRFVADSGFSLRRSATKIQQRSGSGKEDVPSGPQGEVVPTEQQVTSSGVEQRGSGFRNGKSQISDDASSRKKIMNPKAMEERESLVLWRRPLHTLHYFLLECEEQVSKVPSVIKAHLTPVLVCVAMAVLMAALCIIPGPHSPFVKKVQKQLFWCFYWFGLGVLSSIGLGTGLHTFLLYLGPHIASVTIAAYECGGLNFPEPPYPDEIKCPSWVDPLWATSLWTIMCKVWVEAVMWGAGTAAGELPPYFMARMARLSGMDANNEDELREFQEFQKKREDDPELLTYIDRLKFIVEDLVKKMGFFGILACASIPNPLFDLAGITCGHFLVPFWTFFGATLIGKAVIKMMIQQLFVIVAFNEALVAKAVARLDLIPYVGHLLQEPLKAFFKFQKDRLHGNASGSMDQPGHPISLVFDLFVFTMVVYFIVSIVNSVAQRYHKRFTNYLDLKFNGTTTPFRWQADQKKKQTRSALDARED